MRNNTLGFDIDSVPDHELVPYERLTAQTPILLQRVNGDVQEVTPSPGMWPTRLAFDIALGVDDEATIQERYALSEAQYNFLLAQPSFRAEVAAHASMIQEQGVSFAVKAKMIAEEKLDDMYMIISNTGIDPGLRVSAWRAVVKAAGLEESKSEVNNGVKANTVNIQICY